MKLTKKDWIWLGATAIGIGTLAVMLFLFIGIFLNGYVRIYEPSKLILTTEMFILVLGIW